MLCLVSLAAFDSSADITGLPVQSLTTMRTLHKFFLLCLCLPLCLPLSLLCVSFFLSLFSQLDSRDNNGVSVSFLQILFSNQLANKHCSPPVLFYHLPFISVSLSVFLPCKGSFCAQTKSPVILNIPTFLSTFRFSLAAWICANC